VLDHDQETLIKLSGQRLKSYSEKFIPPVDFAKQHLDNLKTNLKTFLARDFHMKSGMKYLMESFYNSIVHGTPDPIPYREIVLTAKIMDAIFDQLNAKPAASGLGQAAGRPREVEPRLVAPARMSIGGVAV